MQASLAIERNYLGALLDMFLSKMTAIFRLCSKDVECGLAHKLAFNHVPIIHVVSISRDLQLPFKMRRGELYELEVSDLPGLSLSPITETKSNPVHSVSD